jgi:hypothetical protein
VALLSSWLLQGSPSDKPPNASPVPAGCVQCVG